MVAPKALIPRGQGFEDLSDGTTICMESFVMVRQLTAMDRF